LVGRSTGRSPGSKIFEQDLLRATVLTVVRPAVAVFQRGRVLAER
jgi:hypothetical protein